MQDRREARRQDRQDKILSFAAILHILFLGRRRDASMYNPCTIQAYWESVR
jgi:hypothetical protein